jgi:predicted ATPase
VALLRADPTEEPAGSHVLALGVLGALRALARGRGLLVALDDIHWLDPASLEALGFVLRRTGIEQLRVLMARRTGPVPPLERAVPPDRLTRVDVGPQSLGATRQLLAKRLGLRLSRHDLRRVHELTQGNPLFVLGVGRLLTERRSSIDHLPVPRDVEELLGTRLTTLPT